MVQRDEPRLQSRGVNWEEVVQLTERLPACDHCVIVTEESKYECGRCAQVSRGSDLLREIPEQLHRFGQIAVD